MTEMADPSVQSDNARFRENSKALAEIQPLVEQFRRYKDVVAQIEATQELLKDPDMRELAQEELKNLEPDARQPPRRNQSAPRSEGPERRQERRPRNQGRHRRRRSGALRVGPVPDVFAVRGASGLAPRSPEPQRQRRRRDQGSHRAHRRSARVQPAEVRERRAPRPARPGDRSKRPDPHLDRDGGRPAGSGRGRHPRRRRRISGSTRSARAAPVVRASTPPTPRSASRTSQPASSCLSRTRNRRSRTARRR